MFPEHHEERITQQATLDLDPISYLITVTTVVAMVTRCCNQVLIWLQSGGHFYRDFGWKCIQARGRLTFLTITNMTLTITLTFILTMPMIFCRFLLMPRVMGFMVTGRPWQLNQIRTLVYIQISLHTNTQQFKYITHKRLWVKRYFFIIHGSKLALHYACWQCYTCTPVQICLLASKINGIMRVLFLDYLYKTSVQRHALHTLS